MKPIALTLAALLVITTGFAGPLHKEQVAADVKWLIHLDVDSFLTSQVGQFVAQEFIEKKVAEHAGDLKKQFGVSFDWRKIHGVTAYGAEYKMRGEPSGVLIIDTDLAVADMLEAVMALLGSQTGKDSPLTKVQTEPFPIYTMKNQVFGAPLKGNLFLLSRSKDDLEKACKVVAGKEANLTSTKTLNRFPDAPKGFIFLGVAEGFIDAPLPPQAKVLKNADGGQVVAGEKGDKLFVQLSLSGKDAESATQIQQVLQGLLALASLAQSENKDLQELTQATKITGSDRVVTVNLEVPISSVMEHVASEQKKSSGKKKHSRKSAEQ